jgi:hypothetical protein
MGLSFHYNGRFKPGASLPAMIEEVKDLAEIYQWQYHIYEESFPAAGSGKSGYNQKMYGISFTPPGCETVWLCFLSNGKMSSPVHLQFYGKRKDREAQEYLYALSVKTQPAGMEIHIILIHLLKYLAGKYFQDFTIDDEGRYWETGDPAILEDNFKRYNFLVNNFTASLEQCHRDPGEDLKAYFERILKQIHEKYKK